MWRVWFIRAGLGLQSSTPEPLPMPLGFTGHLQRAVLTHWSSSSLWTVYATGVSSHEIAGGPLINSTVIEGKQLHTLVQICITSCVQQSITLDLLRFFFIFLMEISLSGWAKGGYDFLNEKLVFVWSLLSVELLKKINTHKTHPFSSFFFFGQK